MVRDTGFHIWFITTRYYKMRQILFQNATSKCKMRRNFVTKCDSFIIKCDSYYKLQQFHYKMLQLSENGTFLLQILTVDNTTRTETVADEKMSCKHYPKWNGVKGNICTCVYFIKTRNVGFYWMGFCWTIPKTKFHFI